MSFTGFPPAALTFYEELAADNTRAFWQANKSRYETLTDALKAQAARSPFHGVVGRVSRHDTGNPFGWLTAVVDIALDDPSMGAQLREWLTQRAAVV